eukprot:COSAG01_NODE_9754_length_2352_cov_3.522858_4_plen_69_part_00
MVLQVVKVVSAWIEEGEPDGAEVCLEVRGEELASSSVTAAAAAADDDDGESPALVCAIVCVSHARARK